MDPVTIATAATVAKPLLTSVLKSAEEGWKNKPLGANSVIEFSKPARNDYITLIEDSLVTQPYAQDICQTALTLVSGYYLSAMTLLVDVPGVNVIRQLDRLSNDRDPAYHAAQSAFAAAHHALGVESFEYGLPTGLDQITPALEAYDAFGSLGGSKAKNDGLNTGEGKSSGKAQHHSGGTGKASEGPFGSLGGESKKPEFNPFGSLSGQSGPRKHTPSAGQTTQNKPGVIQRVEERHTQGFGLGRDTQATLKEVSNLAVGKLLEVNFERDGNRATVQVQMRLLTIDADQKSFVKILTAGGDQNSFKERWYRFKAGELRFVQDLIFCQDLIKEARKSRHDDKTGFYQHMMRQMANNEASGVISGKGSLSKSSAIMIITEETAKQIELEVGGRLSNFKLREQLMNACGTMLLFVIDRKWKMATIYHQSITTPSEMSVAEMKRANKSSGADVEDILRAYTAGSAPSL